jgi:hypothetical protein
MPEDDYMPDIDTYNQYISARVLLPRGDALKKAIIKSRKRDSQGNLIGKHNHNPILDTRVYEVQFPDGSVADYSTNVIAENIFAMVDDDGYETLLFDDIINHRCDPKVATSHDDS